LNYRYPKDIISDILKINDDLTHVGYDPISDYDLQAIINAYINCVSDYPDDEIQEVALPSVDKGNIYHDGVWLADSAASTHMGYDDSRMRNVHHITSQVKIGDAKNLIATKVGDKHLKIVQMDGSTTTVVLHNYKYVPGLWVNLFSITQALMKN
jgi:hypothetical protein